VRTSIQPFLLSTLTFLLFACAGSRHFHPIPAEGPPAVPRYLELRSEAQVATLHFPPGFYSLSAEDDAGYYYAAPRKIAEHRGRGGVSHEGGIFVNKRNQARLRGYIFFAGGLTHVGNLSHAKHEFRD
jgi:hypothetical protein